MDRAGTLSVGWAEERVTGARAGALGLAPGLHLRVDVADTGAGMDAATLAQLFESFLTTKARGQGTGLGLMISRSIVRESGGALTARSAVGEGSVFTIHLPVRIQS
jgi:signal transduction histidine kinase